MKKTRLARASIAELKRRISEAEKSKKEYSDYLKRLKEKYSQRKISYSTYVENIHHKKNGRNISEWVDYLERYEKTCEKEINGQRRTIARRNLEKISLSIIFIFFLFFLISYIQPKFSQTGLTVQQEEAQISETNETGMPAKNSANLTSVNLTKNNTENENNVKETHLYFNLRIAEINLIKKFAANNSGVWTIRILLVLAMPRKKKKKNKELKNDKLLEAFNLITDELKEEYSLNKIELLGIIIEKLKDRYKISRKEILEMTKSEEEIQIPLAIFSKELGCLEAISKYMKENLNMNYHEIAKELDRNERTIWTSYKKAKEKQKKAFEIKRGISIPASIFKNNELTILESIIKYLKEKEMKYSEIAKLLDRNQRNIWTIYDRIIKKKKT